MTPCTKFVSSFQDDEVGSECGRDATHEVLETSGQWEPRCDQHSIKLGMLDTSRIRPLPPTPPFSPDAARELAERLRVHVRPESSKHSCIAPHCKDCDEAADSLLSAASEVERIEAWTEIDPFSEETDDLTAAHWDGYNKAQEEVAAILKGANP